MTNIDCGMNCHQILTGACNHGDRTFSVGSVEGVPFTAYAAGCNIVILASNFERVQILPGVVNEDVQISCIDCSVDTGKIAAAYCDKICIFEPVPLINRNPRHRLDYRWMKTSCISADCVVNNLAWNMEGTRLITGGAMLQIWELRTRQLDHDPSLAYSPPPKPIVEVSEEEEEVKKKPKGVSFRIGDYQDHEQQVNHYHEPEEETWECIWSCTPANPIVYLAGSSDGNMFATVGENDRLVKIWFECKYNAVASISKSFCSERSVSMGSSDARHVLYSFVYLAHPRAVTGIQWRKTSKYMPKGSVSNVLVTSCKDNICRLWVETALPDDGLVNVQHLVPPAAQHPKFRTQRHKMRFMQRWKHMKTCFHFFKKNGHGGAIAKGSHLPKPSESGPIPNLPSTYSAHDFHSYAGLGGGFMPPVVHFHLAGSINAETDIPLVPSMKGTSNEAGKEPTFVVHWLNNKEMHFTTEAESILLDLGRRAMEEEHGKNQNHREPTNQSDSDSGGPESEAVPSELGSPKKPASARTPSEAGELDHTAAGRGSSAASTASVAVGSNGMGSDARAASGTNLLGDALDRKIELLLRDWHHSPDLLFAIHPVDGSFLVWLVDYIDEVQPNGYRQPQVSFACRIPNALPLGDAGSMSPNLALYCDHLLLDLKHALGLDIPVSRAPKGVERRPQDLDNDEDGVDGDNEEESSDEEEMNAAGSSRNTTPTISMLSKHFNGSLNLWRVTFAEGSQYSQVLSIGHVSRVCGHRFRVNYIACHPALPLLVSTSHHNTPLGCPDDSLDDGSYHSSSSDDRVEFRGRSADRTRASLRTNLLTKSLVTKMKPDEVHTSPTKSPTKQSNTEGFCSELILWKVDPVGPLSKSGGVTELARLTSPQPSAFSNCAWIPTLLPSATLGSISNSPSGCFVASDGTCLRVYQAVIDARSLLAEMSLAERKRKRWPSGSSASSTTLSGKGGRENLADAIKIVSQQSTARPGCIIQLDAIADATHDWQNTEFLHVFQEQLVTGERPGARRKSLDAGQGPQKMGLIDPKDDVFVDLEQTAMFHEPFYVVLIEGTTVGSVLHMWKLVISSQPPNDDDVGNVIYADSSIVQDTGRGISISHTSPPRSVDDVEPKSACPVVISTAKVCTQPLPMPRGTHIIHAAPVAGHLSSASIYPACFAPYLIVTACSDNTVRFWKCDTAEDDSLVWKEWNMFGSDGKSRLAVPGTPLNVSAAYTGRVACAYQLAKTLPSDDEDFSRLVNLCVAIYECESTGGSEWVLEDTIQLKHVRLPQYHLENQVDLAALYDEKLRQQREKSVNAMVRTFSSDELSIPAEHDHHNLQETFRGLIAVPSYSTLQTLKRSIIEKGNIVPVPQKKHLMQIDWVSREDGSHLLTIGVGSKVLIFTPISSDVAQSNLAAMKESQTQFRPVLKKASSMVAPTFPLDEIRWMKVREVMLHSADGLPALPMHTSWVRDGILVVAMDSEMHVYSQWKPRHMQILPGDEIQIGGDDTMKSRCLTESDLRSLAQESAQRRLAHVGSLANLPRTISMASNIHSQALQLSEIAKKKMKLHGVVGLQETHRVMVDELPDFGLFEASRIVCPVLPQYHPKQLMELLNSGKIRRVKAILAHLVRCITTSEPVAPVHQIRRTSEEDVDNRRRSWSRSRALSVSGPPGGGRGQMNENIVPEEVTLDYVEISSIPPLPLWVLLQADTETGPSHSNVSQGASQKLRDNDSDYSGLFNMEQGNEDEDDLENLLSDENDGFGGRGDSRRRSHSGDRRGFAYFGPREARALSQLLTHTHLPGLSSLDQMHLLALADTVASCNLNFAERFAIDAAKAQIAKEGNTPQAGGALHQSVDDCGLRFLLAMKHHSYLIRCLPIAQRASLQKQGMGTSTLVWAFHSESEEEILQAIPSYNRGDIKWSELQEIGAGWWLRNTTILRRCVEKVAKAAFQVKHDPLDAAIFYLAMKKKSLIYALYKSIKDIKMATFFANDFTDPRWSKAALKNAYALLGKQRFEHAAAFFLLGGALKDAVEICISKMNDLQLAMVLCRLYDGEREMTPPSLRRILHEYVLGCDVSGNNQDLTLAHYDPFLRSMASWMLGDFSASLNTLLQTNVGEDHSSLDYEEVKPRNSVQAANPSVFNFYTYLRTHHLIIRQHLANNLTDTSMIGMGLSSNSGEGRKPLFEECITSAERRLYFTTAHAHFRAGCPALALEVLSKLPNVVVVDEEGTVVAGLTRAQSVVSTPQLVHQKSIATGTLMDDGPTSFERSDALDWSQPVAKKEDELVLDWGDDNDEDDDLDEDDEDRKSKKNEADSGNGKSPEESKSDIEQKKSGKFDIMAQQLKFIACLQILMEELSTLATGCEVDGGQLRFQLYVWLEREVHALRQLCNYNEDLDDHHESAEDSDAYGEMEGPRPPSSYPSVSSDKPTLHEILLADKVDFEAKLERAIKRKQWLRANQTLLRTLLSYCSLHGASGGGLASVRMELILLLQELQQDRAVSGVGSTQNHLLSPLPLPTTLPLIAAVVAPNKTVVHDPIKHLQSLAQDLLQAAVEFFQPPTPGGVEFPRVFVMRDLGIALSSCIYQCLCDSDSFVVKHHRGGVVGMELDGLLQRGVVYQNSHLTAGLLRRKQVNDEETLHVTTPPNKWPGVTSLRALLARERDEDAPKLNILLCESYVAVYVSLLVFGLATCDCHVLYRLIAQDFTERSWASLFGGGVKKLLKVATSNSAVVPERKQSVKEDSPGGQDQDTGILSSLTKQRLRLNMRLLSFSGQQHSSLKQAMKEDRPTYREQFMPPDLSFLALLMAKPTLPREKADIDYDSTAPSEASDGESEEEEDFEEDVFKEPEKKKPGKDVDNTEHSDPYSYSWGILRYAVIKIAQEYLNKFLEVAGLEHQELPVVSPLIHAVLRVLQHWSKSCKEFLDVMHGPPADYIPGIFVERNVGGPAISKYKAILDPNNTPFMKSKSAPVKAIKRLWMFLVHEDSVQEIFIRYIFSSRLRTGLATISMSDSTLLIGDEASNTAGNQSSGTTRRGLDLLDGPPVPGPVKIIHKEHDSISAFCINKTNPGLMAIATLKEIQELDIGLLLQAPAWLEDECEFDILNLHRDAESLPSSSYLVVGERPMMGAGGSGTPVGAPNIPSSASSTHPLSLAAGASPSNPNFSAQNHNSNQTGRGSTVLKHHKIDNVKRLSAHPLLPLYLSGSQDGSVHLWEWDHANPVSQPRAPGTYAKVTRVRFSQHGNKFGVSDADGNVSLWQLGLNSVVTRPFYTVQCHSKNTTDFVFIGGSSLFASSGHGSDNRNVCIWDTLLPIKRSLVQTFSCHDQGCQSITYAPQHQMLITGGKKGDVCLIDVRQRTIRHTFAAHHSAVKCIALDPNEEFFVTGSADGDIKVWGLTLHSMVYSFPGEHARSSFFKAQGQGVTQLYVDSQGRLFSCGADGSMKLRHLPVNTSMFV